MEEKLAQYLPHPVASAAARVATNNQTIDEYAGSEAVKAAGATPQSSGRIRPQFFFLLGCPSSTLRPTFR